MKKWMPVLISLGTLLALSYGNRPSPPSMLKHQREGRVGQMELGNFSVSLAVKDLRASLEFYRQLGFHEVGGNAAQNWVILQNSTSTIGLFQGMFEKNVLTFNPGWDRDKKTLPEFEDVRALQKQLKQQGLKLSVEADENSTGPASFVISDPDGNQILVDQHVARPDKK